jgi:DNA topoisomerase I
MAAASAGLRYIADDRPGIRRRRSGGGFCYVRADGSRLSNAEAVKRIRSLAIPPAWTDVWICPLPDGHLQATGRDAKGRKQYIYHLRFREIRDSTKFQRLTAFADALPAIRNKVREHMALAGLPREKVVATVVHLLDKTLIRIGNDEYARRNKSYGLTTLKNRHVQVDGSEVRFRFVGKSGKEWSAKIRDRRVAKIIRACQDLPGQELLQYRGDDGTIQDVTSSDVNEYLRETTGQDVTAKDFRTWAGTVLAAIALKELEGLGDASKSKKRLRAAIETVAVRLGNTVAVCRKCYIHPEVLSAFMEGTLARDLTARAGRLSRDKLGEYAPEEAAVLAMLRSRPQRAVNGANGPEHRGRMLPNGWRQFSETLFPLERDGCQAGHAQRKRGRRRDVDDATTHKRPPVVDRNDHRASVAAIGDPHLRSERQ